MAQTPDYHCRADPPQPTILASITLAQINQPNAGRLWSSRLLLLLAYLVMEQTNDRLYVYL